MATKNGISWYCVLTYPPQQWSNTYWVNTYATRAAVTIDMVLIRQLVSSRSCKLLQSATDISTTKTYANISKYQFTVFTARLDRNLRRAVYGLRTVRRLMVAYGGG